MKPKSDFRSNLIFILGILLTLAFITILMFLGNKGNKKMKYFAYGSNLNKAAMATRCPNAVAIGKYELKGYRLTFRGGLPDILPEEGSVVTGGLWEITETCEMSLDSYEGYHGPGFPNNLYNKYFTDDGIMFYRMASSVMDVPEDGYTGSIFVNMMVYGLSDFGITAEEIYRSLGLDKEGDENEE